MAKDKSPTLTELATVDYLANRIERPQQWVEARLAELDCSPAMRLNGVEYFPAETLGLLREVSEEWAERIQKAKREAVAAGE